VNQVHAPDAPRSALGPRSAQQTSLASRLSIKHVLTSTEVYLNIIQSAASTYFAKQSFLFWLPSTDGRSVYVFALVLFILFRNLLSCFECILKVTSIFETRCALHRALNRATTKEIEDEGKMEGRECAIDAHYAGERAGELVCVEILDLNREQNLINFINIVPL